MKETEEQWAERMLALCEGYEAPVSELYPGLVLTSRRTKSTATVSVSDSHTTTLVFGGTRSVQFPTQHVRKHYL